MIEPVADQLKISRSRIYANNLLFNADGTFQGFDPTEFTSADQGKPKAIRFLKDKFGYRTVVMVGDGATVRDCENTPLASLQPSAHVQHS